MRQVSPSPNHYFNCPMIESVLAALLEGAPQGPGTMLEIVERNLGRSDLAGAVAQSATELHAKIVVLSRMVITADMVVAIVYAAVDVFGKDLNLNGMGWAMRDPDRTGGFIRRADALYHEALRAQADRALAAAGSPVVSG